MGALAALIIGLSVAPGVTRLDDNLFSWLYAGAPATVQKVLHIIIYVLLAFPRVWALASIEPTRLRLGISLLLALGSASRWSGTSHACRGVSTRSSMHFSTPSAR